MDLLTGLVELLAVVAVAAVAPLVAALIPHQRVPPVSYTHLTLPTICSV